MQRIQKNGSRAKCVLVPAGCYQKAIKCGNKTQRRRIYDRVFRGKHAPSRDTGQILSPPIFGWETSGLPGQSFFRTTGKCTSTRVVTCGQRPRRNAIYVAVFGRLNFSF